MKLLGAWASVVASCATVACLVISPLDDVERGSPGGSGGQTDAAAGSGGGGSCEQPCTTHSECGISETNPGRCIEGCCVPLKNEDCRCVPDVVTKAWSEPNSILIPVFAPLEQQADECGTESVSVNYRLAAEEINAKELGSNDWDGLPSKSPTSRRRIVLLLCDNYEAPIHENIDFATRLERVKRAANHVTTDLHAQAIVAMLHPDMLPAVFDEYGAKKGVFFLDPNGPTNELANLPADEKDNLLWHMLGKPGDVAATYAAILPKLEARARAQTEQALFQTQDEPLRVALLVGDDVFSKQLADAIEDSLAGVIEAPDVLQRMDVPTEQEAFQKFTAEELVDFKPHIVLSAMDKRIYKVWVDLDAALPAPYFVLSPSNFGTVETSFRTALNSEAGHGNFYIVERVLGVNIAGSEDTDLLNEFGIRLAELSDRLGVSAKRGENYYDAIYYLTYAIVGATEGDPAPGYQIGEVGFADITLGSALSHQVGPDDMFSAVSDLMAGKQIRLEGMSGDGPFDLPTGVRRSTGAVFCYDNEGTDVRLVDHVLHQELGGELRRAKQYQAVSTLPCADFLDPEGN